MAAAANKSVPMTACSGMAASAAATPASVAFAVRLIHQASKGSAANTKAAGDAGPPAAATTAANATVPSASATNLATRVLPVMATRSAVEKGSAQDCADAGERRRNADKRRQENGCRRGDQEWSGEHYADETPLAKTFGRLADGSVNEALAVRGDGVKQLTGSGPRQTHSTHSH